jgi:hypothetical protein
VSLETIYFLKFYLFNILIQNSITNSINTNYRAFYAQSINPDDLHSLQRQIFLFCGINPRLDLPQSNAFFKKNLTDINIDQLFFASYIGAYSIFSYGITYLGYAIFSNLNKFFYGKL